MSLQRLTSGPLTLGLELALDNDWSPAGEAARLRDGRAFGVPDLSEHLQRVQLADRLGFRALWLRDVPLYDPHFGDAGQVFEMFTYLGLSGGVHAACIAGHRRCGAAAAHALAGQKGRRQRATAQR